MEYKHTGFALTKMLIDYGVEYIFGIPGGQTLPLYDGCYAYKKEIKHICMRDERHAGHAALAYSRINGKLGVCDVTVGPGATNLPSALGEALNSSTPMLAIVGDHPVGWANKVEFGRASQGIDQISMLKPVCKKVIYVPTQESLPEMLNTAFVEATSGRPGPVALVIPADVFKAEGGPSKPERYIRPELNSYPQTRTMPDPARIAEAAKLLLKAKSPVMLVGGGAMISGAMDIVKNIAELMSMPVAYTITGKGVLPDDHDLNMGVAGIFANTPSAEVALKEADLILMVGDKNSQSSSYLWTVPSDKQKLIHLDIDPHEVGRIFPTDVKLVGDAKLGLEALYGELKKTGEVKGNQEWLKALKKVREQWENKKAGLFASDDKPIKPYRVMAAINNVLGPNDILACDAGFTSGWGALYYKQRSAGRRTLFPRGLAGLGFSVAAGFGAQLADPNSRVVTLAGDAGFTYDMGELSIQAYHNLPIVNIVMNNAAYGWVKWAENAWYQGSFTTSDLPPVDFAKVAEGMGCVGIRIEDPAEIEPRLREALESKKTTVLDVIIDSKSIPNVGL